MYSFLQLSKTFVVTTLVMLSCAVLATLVLPAVVAFLFTVLGYQWPSLNEVVANFIQAFNAREMYTTMLVTISLGLGTLTFVGGQIVNVKSLLKLADVN